MEIIFKQTSSCVLYCGTATRPCSQHKKAAELNYLEVSSPNRELGSRILAKLQEQRCPHMFFYLFSPYVISKILKTKLNFTAFHLFVFSQSGLFLATTICAQLSLASQTHFCTSSAFSDVISCSLFAISPSFQLHLQ